MNKMLTVGTKFSGIGKIPILGGSRLNTLNSIIKVIFSKGEQGFAYDPNDLSTMFQDAAGTIPVTSVGQPVGLILDKSKGLVLGTEQFPNFDFNNWTSVGAVSAKTSSSVTTTGTGGVYKAIPMGFGRTYRIKISGNCNQTFIVRESGVADGQIIVPAGSFDLEIKTPVMFATRLNLYFMIAGGAGTLTLTSLSVCELKGNHAYQTVSASRPILQRNATTGAYYLAFDGVDDFLVTNNIDFTTTDKVSLFAGVRKLSDANAGIVAELSASSTGTPSTFTLYAPTGTNNKGFGFRSRGTNGVHTNGDALSLVPISPVTAVISGIGSITPSDSKLRINGVVSAVSTLTQGTGNYGNHPLYIGRRGGTSLPFSGNIYSLIGIGRLTTDSETIALEKAIAKNVGVTLNV